MSCVSVIRLTYEGVYVCMLTNETYCMYVCMYVVRHDISADLPQREVVRQHSRIEIERWKRPTHKHGSRCHRSAPSAPPLRYMYVCMYALMSGGMHVCMYVLQSKNVCMYSMYVYMYYVNVNLCLYVCMYTKLKCENTSYYYIRIYYV